MTHSKIRIVSIKAAGVSFSLGLLALTVAGEAVATCGDVATPGTQSQHSSNRLRPAVYRPDETGASAVTTGFESWIEPSPVVGLWEFEVHLTSAQNGFPNGFLLDWGLATWHSDGTEIQFSAGRPPAAGDVCMGAWHEVGPSRFDLHHVALGLTPPDASGMFVGPTIITATVTVDRSGDSYAGPYNLNVYAGSPDNGTEFNETGAPLMTFNGTITAKRVFAK
jgi:hypothetical protein